VRLRQNKIYRFSWSPIPQNPMIARRDTDKLISNTQVRQAPVV